MEIVTYPDMRSPEEAEAYVAALRTLLRAIGASDGEMDKGSLRCDVNISVNKIGEPWGTRCEIKNLNSVRFMVGAINSEIRRHIALLESSSSVSQETRGFDENTFETFKLRSKEDAPDYRYMPDPNLGTLVLSPARIESIRSSMPELPWQTRQRLLSAYELPEKSVDFLMKLDSTKDVPLDGEMPEVRGAIAYFDALCAGGKRSPAVVFNWVANELVGQLTTRKESFSDNTLSVDQLSELIDLVQSKQLTGAFALFDYGPCLTLLPGTSAKFLLRHMLANPSAKSTREIAEAQQLMAIPSISTATESSDVGLIVQRALDAMPREVEALGQGHKGVMNKIVGWVMRESRGRANAKEVSEMIQKRVGN